MGKKRKRRTSEPVGMPEEMLRMHAELDENPEWKLVLFRDTHDREPESDWELQSFIERLVRSRYNDGIDHVDLL